ncbi:hypothetical protein LOC54_06775 [Acetobacter sp. AN02]|uniref:hypothetical protein n=1 Tax=Acetobacter sp. AN02 TaxID=2894186 RepID=UPI002434669D|nr:hypothetical protein [Acetobacter sp. AN02]MDG6094814.1 hypothetical protein [Acetobacter sp. AN02]
MKNSLLLPLGRCLGAFALAGTTLVAVPSARAWAPPSSCGTEPSAPSVETSSVEKYNASIDKVTAYEKQARAYNSCVAKEATKTESAISAKAKEEIGQVHDGAVGVQQRIAASFTKLTKQLKAGQTKFGVK